MSVHHLIAPIAGGQETVTLSKAQQWMQGRTLYGGASALIAYMHAVRTFGDLPPFRAGQIGFVAPVGDTFELRSEIVRQGRNVTQLRSEILCDGKVALTAFWLFGAARDANAMHSASPPVPDPGNPDDMTPADTRHAPAFLSNNYDVRYSSIREEAGTPIIRRWVKLKELADIDPVAELILLGDTLPPSAARIMQRVGPLSSINWSFNLLDPAPVTRDGWWLAETASDHADDGYSSERLRLWNADGRQMLAGMQAVAIFG
ncbi:MAG: thioesterase family protein [Pontixanthobacter sp.]